MVIQKYNLNETPSKKEKVKKQVPNVTFSGIPYTASNYPKKKRNFKWLLFLWSIPIAIVGNIARVTIIVVVARLVGREKAMWFHDHVAGYMVFVVGITMMLWVGAWMRRHKDTPKKTGPPWS